MLRRCRKLKDATNPLLLSSRFETPVRFSRGISTHLNYLNIGCNRRKESLIGIQERYKWENSKDDSNVRKIRAEANCPRCSKHMDVLFSNRSFVFSNNSNLDHHHHHHHHLSRNNDTANNNTNNTTTADTGACNGNGHNNNYQAVNFCPNCKTAYYFRPDKIAPLQGSFVEIGRINNKGNGRNGNKGGKEGSNGVEEGADYANVTNTINNRLRVSFWETLRSYGGDPPENWPQGIPPPPPPGGNGLKKLKRSL